MGDEGKGRLVHEAIAEIQDSTGRTDAVGMVLKVNGGANAGHTAAGLKLNLLPCGVPETDVPYLGIGAGVVADPRKFWWELRPLEMEDRYEVFSRLLIDERCMLSDLTHRLLDLAWEDYRVNVLQDAPRGSTGRGISPTYGEETLQTQIGYQCFKGEKDPFVKAMLARISRAEAIIQHVCQVSPETWISFFDRLTETETRANLEAVNARIFDRSEFDFHQFRDPEDPFTLDRDALIDTYWQAGSALAPAIGDIRETVLTLLNDGKFIIGEFGQAYWLDKRHGFSPNVTASHTFCPEFFQSAGIPVRPIHNIGVCKAYDTKVGTHLFLSEMEDDNPLASRLKQIEFGTSTGRQRMVGWFDAVEKGDAIRFGGCEDIMINKIDVLANGEDWTGNLKICVAYEDTEGKAYPGVPRDDTIRAQLRPRYIELPSWTENLSDCRKWDELPESTQIYVAMMMYTTIQVATRGGDSPLPRLPNLRYLGVGPEPKQIIKDLPDTESLLELAGKLAKVMGML